MQGDRIMTGSVYGSTAKRGGLVANIERYALNDGLGVRTTVFLKCCPLKHKVIRKNSCFLRTIVLHAAPAWKVVLMER